MGAGPSIEEIPIENSNHSINIQVIFKEKENPLNEIIVETTFNEKISDLLEKYRKLLKDKSINNKKFIFKNKNLVNSLTVSDAGIYNKCTIIVISLKGSEEDNSKPKNENIKLEKNEDENEIECIDKYENDDISHNIRINSFAVNF